MSVFTSLLENVWPQIKQISVIITHLKLWVAVGDNHPLEVVGRCSETQLQVASRVKPMLF